MSKRFVSRLDELHSWACDLNPRELSDDVISLIEVVQAAQKVMKSEVIMTAPFAGYSEALSNLNDSLKRFNE